MSSRKNSPKSENKELTGILVTYRPAALKHNAHGWTVEYYAIDPAAGTLKRHAIKLNVLRKQYARLSDFRAHCNQIICALNNKLAGGWSPFGENQNARYYTPIETVMERYIDEKSEELRPDTMRSYKSFCSGFGKWIHDNVPGCQTILFNRVLAIRYLEHCSTARKLKGRSWNNQLKSARAFFSWAVGKCYCKENPFEGLAKKRESEKTRTLVPPDTRRRITEWCEAKNKGLLIVCQLVYSALIRPKEIRNIRVADVYLDEHYIHIRPDVAKTHYGRFASLKPELEALLRQWIGKAKPTDFLIGRDYNSCGIQQSHSRFDKDWAKLRRALDLPKDMQLYSLRDTGINEMLKSGIDPLTVMQHADHHDLSMTTRYANHADPNLVRTISERAPKF